MLFDLAQRHNDFDEKVQRRFYNVEKELKRMDAWIHRPVDYYDVIEEQVSRLNKRFTKTLDKLTENYDNSIYKLETDFAQLEYDLDKQEKQILSHHDNLKDLAVH